MKASSFTLALAILSLASTLLGQGTDSGSLRGRITDSTGAALPGATITAVSPAVIGGRLTAVTSSEGLYRFPALPPGIYEVRMELQGFKAVSVADVRINVGVGLTIDKVLELAAVEEAVTVVGESPIVDTKNTTGLVNWTTEHIQKIPNAGDHWAAIQQIPGIVMGKENVGGFESAYGTDFQVHGSIGGTHQYNYNGIDMSLNLSRGLGFAIGYFNMDAFEEVQLTTSGVSAEHSRGGMIMNVVVKSGGNNFNGLVAAHYESDALQSNNIDDELRERGVTAGGAPLDQLTYLSANLGGPIVKDRIWFFAALRDYDVVPFILNCTLPDGSQCTDAADLTNLTTKITAQFDKSNRLMFNYEFGRLLRPTRDISQFTRPEAAYYEDFRYHIFQVKYDRILSSNAVLEATFGAGSPPFPLDYQESAQGRTTAFDEITRVRFDAAPQNFFERGDIYTFGGGLTYFRDRLLGAAHDIKLGAEHRRGELFRRHLRNGDLERRYQNGVPYRVTVFNTPVEQFANSYGLAGYVQDSVRVGERMTLNLGLRIEWWRGDVPEQSNQPTTFADVFGGAATYPEQKGVMGWTTFSPRLGVVYDLAGDSKTVLKGSYGRYFFQMHSSDLNNFSNRNGLATATYDWRDLNGNNFPDYPLEFGTLRSLNLPARRSIVAGLNSPYTDEATASIERGLNPTISVTARYTYRKNKGILAETDLALPDSAFSIPSTAIDPLTGNTVSYWSLGPEYRTVTNQRVLTQFDSNYTRYHGLDLVFNRRFHGGWLFMASLTIQDTYGRVGGFLDRNDREIFPYGSVGLDAPYLGKIVGTVMLPRNIQVSGFFRHTTGLNVYGSVNAQMARLLQVRDVTTNSLYQVRVEENGSFRQESTNILDLRVSKVFEIKGTKLEAMLDGFNLTNANNIMRTGVITGSDYNVPLNVLAPRIFRVGLKFEF